MSNMQKNEYDKADFQGLYQGKTLIDSAEVNMIPWDIGRAQPAVCAILDAEKPGTLLDVGCGLGRNAEAAAKRGFKVTALDSSSVAIEHCRQNVDNNIFFLVANACATQLDEKFDIILDSALYHAIPANERITYLQEMRRLSHTETLFHIITFAPEKHGMPLPLAIPLSDICKNAEMSGWNIISSTQTEYKGNAQAIVDFCEKKNLKILIDEKGFTRLPCWHVTLKIIG